MSNFKEEFENLKNENARLKRPFPPHPAHHTRPADATHASASEKTCDYASPPPFIFSSREI